jgi:hypothetical protein
MSIADSDLGKLQVLTAEQIRIYQINAGPGGTWKRDWYESNRLELKGYQFHLQSVIQDEKGYYYLTITKPK